MTPRKMRPALPEMTKENRPRLGMPMTSGNRPRSGTPMTKENRPRSGMPMTKENRPRDGDGPRDGDAVGSLFVDEEHLVRVEVQTHRVAVFGQVVHAVGLLGDAPVDARLRVAGGRVEDDRALEARV